MTKPTWREKLAALKALGKRVNHDTDGCTGVPDLNFKPCCEEHDAYTRNPELGISRAEADRRLRKCLQRRWGLPILPWVYWAGARMFGWIPWRRNRKGKK